VFKIWTHQVGIRGTGSIPWGAVIVDGAGKVHPLAYRGHLFQGPTPPELRGVWLWQPASPPPAPLRLRLTLLSGAGNRTVELDEALRFPESSGISRASDLCALMRTAVDQGDLDVVHAALDAGAPPNVFGEHRVTPLIAASAAGDVDLVRALLARGAAPNTPNEVRITPLLYALWFGGLPTVEALLAGGADPDQPGYFDRPLRFAAERGDAAAVRLLLRFGARHDAPCRDGDPALPPGWLRKHPAPASASP
jgi:hypothetical protein